MSGRLAGKTALVTGAARGIGRALAIGLAAEGALVHLLDHEDPAAVVKELAVAGQGLALRCDVSDVTAIRTAFSRLDRLDVLVNCAGVTGWIDALDPAEETWDRVIDTNLKGTFFCSSEAARLMRGTGGSIVNVTSVLGIRGMPNSAAYAASKGGINSLTVQLAIELAPHRIRVNAFGPGATNVERNLTDDPSSRGLGARDSPGPCRRARGDGRPGRVPGIGRVGSRHRPDALRRRRLDGDGSLPRELCRPHRRRLSGERLL